ncbi:ABC transporter ATP-binding protein [Jannaschia sp. LMIT008]|uniref:ABC transporter ATP-binding protein n=1 Tax=Jannaschia maritima TaxID=3032585 RepID=UPI0035AB7973
MTGDGSPAVEARGARKAFGGFVALQGVDLAIAAGEFFTLLGPSGCGKTTLLRLIAGFEGPTEGSIHIAGQDVTADPPHRRPVNTVFQSYALFPHLSVFDNVAFGLRMLGRGDVDARTAAMLDLVALSDFAQRKPAQLSGGQQQRVALARALAPDPQVLLLDEPLSALDLKLRRQMQRELKRLQGETGITFVFVTHDQEEALTMSDRIAVMEAGRILQVGTPRAVYDEPATRFVAGFIGESNVLAGSVRDGIADLPGGRVPVAAPDGPVQVAIRPERVRLVASGTDGALGATLAQAVYHGTDLTAHLVLPDGTEVAARLPADAEPGAPGSAHGLAFDPGDLRVLAD